MTTKKRGRGRPRGSTKGSALDEQVPLRLPADLRGALEKEAAKMMLPLSSYIRLVLLERGSK